MPEAPLGEADIERKYRQGTVLLDLLGRLC